MFSKANFKQKVKKTDPLNQRLNQHGRRTVFNDHNQQSQTNKQFDLKYKETTLALGLTNMQSKREINLKKTRIQLRTYFYDCPRNWRTYKKLVELLDKRLSELTILNGLAKLVSLTAFFNRKTTLGDATYAMLLRCLNLKGARATLN